MTIIDWMFVALYLVVLLIIGYQTSKRVETSDDFAVAGRRIVWPVLFATLAASFFGGGSALGAAGEVFADGYLFMFAIFFYNIQVVLMGYFVVPRLAEYKNAVTVGDIMHEHYGRVARLLTGILSLAVCAGILGGQALAMGLIFNTILGWPTSVGIVLGMIIVLIYSTLGGMWAVIQTDVVQFVVLGIVIPATLIIGLVRVGGPAELISSVPETHLGTGTTWTIGIFAGTALALFLGEALLPPYAQRAFSAPDSSNARKGYVMAGVLAFFYTFVVSSIGLVALALYPDLDSGLAFPTVVKEMLPIGVTGLALAALLAVIMSTVDSFLNSTAVVFVKDIYQPFVNPNLSDSRRLWLERVVNVIVAIAATIFALSATSIFDVLLLSYALWAPTIVIPLVLAVVWKFRSPVAALSAIVAGAVGTGLWTWALGDPFGIPGLAIGVSANALAFFLAYKMIDRGANPRVA